MMLYGGIKMNKNEIRAILEHQTKDELIEIIIKMYNSTEELINLHLAEIGENGLH